MATKLRFSAKGQGPIEEALEWPYCPPTCDDRAYDGRVMEDGVVSMDSVKAAPYFLFFPSSSFI
jgi:hypothetical protein